jgi:hypothetical protein
MITGDDRELFARSIEHAVSTPSVDEALAELGWSDALADDPRTAISLLFEHQGLAGSTSGALSVVLSASLGLDESVSVVLPPVCSVAPAGRRSSERVAVDGLLLGPVGSSSRVAIPLADGVLLVDAGDLTSRAVAGLDPRLGLEAVSGALYSEVLPSTPWVEAIADGQRALAHELVGASRTMLELARVHALERVQFDRPIAGFQAVRHRLAESLVAIEGAAAATDEAWDAGTPWAAATAKAIAGRSARVVAKHSQQVLAGIGFTTEHPLHTYIKRVLVLDRLLGDARGLTRAAGEQLLRDRSVPAAVPL